MRKLLYYISLLILKNRCSPISNSNISSNTQLVVICSGNGCPFELYHRGHKWINYYLNINNTHILLWNYRGYGKSTGSATVKNIKYDAQIVIDFIISKYKYSQILLHGISIGGVAVCSIQSE